MLSNCEVWRLVGAESGPTGAVGTGVPGMLPGISQTAALLSFLLSSTALRGDVYSHHDTRSIWLYLFVSCCISTYDCT